MKVNENAPAVSSAEVEVAADPEVVWEVLTAIEAWPSWNPDVTSASLEGELAEGSRFRWKAGRATITSTLQRVEPPRLIAWTGKTLGLRAIHVWRLEAHGAGTFVSTAESWEGPVATGLSQAHAGDIEQGGRGWPEAPEGRSRAPGELAPGQPWTPLPRRTAGDSNRSDNRPMLP